MTPNIKKVKLISVEHENKMKQLDFSTMESGWAGEKGLMESRVWWHLKRLTVFSRVISDSTVTAYWCKTDVRQNSERWRKKESVVGEKGDVIVIINVIDLAECACHQIIFIRYLIHLKVDCKLPSIASAFS